MRKILVIHLLLFLIHYAGHAQSKEAFITGKVLTREGLPAAGATISLLKPADSSLIRITSADVQGSFRISQPASECILSVSATGHIPYFRLLKSVEGDHSLAPIKLAGAEGELRSVTVTAKKAAVEFQPDRTVVHVESILSNAGATALEVLEKSPGVSTDKDGNLSLNGKPNVLVMIDGKPSYLSPADLSNMLGSMSASQIDQIELMSNPSSRYDAAGSGGIIHLKLKKNRSKGFNGSASTTISQGFYPKSTNNLQLNYRAGKWNGFANYTFNPNQGFGELYALRKYYEADGKTVTGMLEQPSFFKFTSINHSIKTGIDYSIGTNTSIALSFTGQHSDRRTRNGSTASWKSAQGITDSIIETSSHNTGFFRNAGVNLHVRHQFRQGKELTADIDQIGYRIGSNQEFKNEMGGSNAYTENIRGDLPSTLKIFSAKADFAQPFLAGGRLEGGVKMSRIHTDNFASYFTLENEQWQPDYTKTNHFIYSETIQAAYANVNKEVGKWNLQGGLRFENTAYDADQKDNPTRSDSSFSNHYSSLFPSTLISYKADSNHQFSISAGRRLDRPAFQKLNPFIFIINKYTYQQGNPYILPQYSWNFELSHNYRDLLVTTISYSETSNYFSQIFHSDPATGLIIYSEGNLGRMRNLSLSLSSQLRISSWWSASLQGSVTDKKIEGFVWDQRTVSLATFYFTGNNQFKFGRGWSAELSGFFHTSEPELQEITDPTGQVAVGIGKQVLKNKGSLKLTARDLFYTQAMKGNTVFLQASEYFKFTRDTRVVNLAFTYRFGKTFKGMGGKKGGAEEEMERAGN